MPGNVVWCAHVKSAMSMATASSVQPTRRVLIAASALSASSGPWTSPRRHPVWRATSAVEVNHSKWFCQLPSSEPIWKCHWSLVSVHVVTQLIVFRFLYIKWYIHDSAVRLNGLNTRGFIYSVTLQNATYLHYWRHGSRRLNISWDEWSAERYPLWPGK